MPSGRGGLFNPTAAIFGPDGNGDGEQDLYVANSQLAGFKKDNVKWIFAVTPALAEQMSISAFLDRKTSKLDALIQKKQRLIDLLNEKRAALISHAVTKQYQMFQDSPPLLS